jgi:hypothetical protein
MSSSVLPSSAQDAPWYRHRWPWLLGLGPAIVVVAGFYSLFLAVHTDDGLVADDYYKRGLAINQTLARTAKSAALDLAATVDVEGDGTVHATLSSNGALPPVVRLRLLHPTRAGLDEGADLALGPGGRYTGHVQPGLRGRRLVVVETADWRLGPVEVDAESLHVVVGVPLP